jgi:hypothetical protein
VAEARRLQVEAPDWSRDSVSLGLSLDGRRHEIRYAAEGLRPVEADFALAAALIPAMTTDGLELGAPVSPRLLEVAPLLQDVFASWTEELSPVPIEARAYDPPAPSPRGAACFFSGGIDSFYTVFKHRQTLSHLIFLHGFDIPIEGSAALRRESVAAAREVAAALGMSVLEVETDLRDFSEPLVSWWSYYVAALASIGHLLGDRFSRVLIPSGGIYSDPVTWSHPLLDPLWSTETTQIVNDGGEARRIVKVADVARQDLAMRWLRVCWENPDGAYNCGRCEKCLRTMIGLRAVGALERCATLPSEIDPDAVAAMPVNDSFELGFARENLAALERLGTEPALVEGLREAMTRSEKSYSRAIAAEQRAQELERALADFKRTRRYRFTQALARPLDAARGRSSRT